MTTLPRLADLLALPLRMENGDMVDANGNTPDEGKSEPECLAMGAAVVRALNAHDEMLDALRELVLMIDINLPEWAPVIEMQRARDALAKAERT